MTASIHFLLLYPVVVPDSKMPLVSAIWFISLTLPVMPNLSWFY